MTKIAILQMTSGIDPETNCAEIECAAAEAAGQGASALFTPEMALLLDRDRQRATVTIAAEEYGSYVSRLARCSQSEGIDIALGSMPVALADGRLANRSCYFPAAGSEARSYDKLHMFDVDLASGESWRESNVYVPGNEVVTVDNTPIGRLGLSICYDIRFPALFEALGQARCDAIAIPAAFTVPTGQAHWHLLQRARAVEASAYVIAAAQIGEHEDGRRTYGHSLVVDPWGDVLLDMGGEAPGLGFAEVNLERVSQVRSQLPSLANRREIANSKLS